jgi:hypothetical protein
MSYQNHEYVETVHPDNWTSDERKQFHLFNYGFFIERVDVKYGKTEIEKMLYDVSIGIVELVQIKPVYLENRVVYNEVIVYFDKIWLNDLTQRITYELLTYGTYRLVMEKDVWFIRKNKTKFRDMVVTVEVMQKYIRSLETFVTSLSQRLEILEKQMHQQQQQQQMEQKETV